MKTAVLLFAFCMQWLTEGKKLAVDLTVDSSQATFGTSETWACANLDWWPPSKCDYGRCQWKNNSMLNINLDDPVLIKAVQAFHGKLRLRLGGSLGDFVVYDFPWAGGPKDAQSLACKQFPENSFSPPTISTKIGYELFSGCLRPERWDALNQFCLKVNCKIAFGLNGLYGRSPPPPCPPDTNCRIPSPPECCTSWSGQWNPANAEALVRYTVEKKYPVIAWELGNELVGKRGIESHIGVEEYVQDWKRFVSMINSVYPNRASRPLLVVPDTTWMTDWFGAFLRKFGISSEFAPDVASHHLYSMGPGVNPQAWRAAINDTMMNQVLALGRQVQSVVSKASPRAQVWLGEGGGCYNSGADNVTNSFNSGFWFLDQMGALASTGHSSYCRQTLVGGFYGLLDAVGEGGGEAGEFRPNPDYYSLLLWTRLMGSEVLQMSRGQAASASTLRVYAHCMATGAPSYSPGGITLLLINLSNSTAVQATLYTTERRDLLSLPREEFFFSSGCRAESAVGETAMRTLLACRHVLLNGQPLKLGEDGSIPNFKSATVHGASPLVVKPLTYGFITFPKAKAAACFRGKETPGVASSSGERKKKH